MLSLEELQQRFDAYKDARISRVQFHDWFEANSYDAYEDARLMGVCVAIDTAFSEYLFENIGEDALKQELASIVYPSPRVLILHYEAPGMELPSLSGTSSSVGELPRPLRKAASSSGFAPVCVGAA